MIGARLGGLGAVATSVPTAWVFTLNADASHVAGKAYVWLDTLAWADANAWKD